MAVAATPLSTEPNAGLPGAASWPRKRVFDEMDDGEAGDRNAAGVLFVAPDGDVLVLRRSGDEANYAGHWALPGGGVDAGETPDQGAARECAEEIGVRPESMKLLDRRRTPTGMTFHTFAAPARDKFVPRLNGEHTGYAWAPLDALPQPLHPAVAATLRERIGGQFDDDVGAEDMTPEDWRALRDGFAAWTREEEDEPEHAEDERGLGADAYLDIAIDEQSVREADGDGRLRIKTAHISKAVVNPYKGSEIPGVEDLGLEPDRIYWMLRDPDELEKAAPTFNGIQVLRRHIPVDAEDHQPYDVVGATGTEAKFNDPYLDNSLTIWSREAIDRIEDGSQKELSCGYHYTPDMTPGYFRGTRYDGVMRDIRGNHVALVEEGRAGPDVVVGDAALDLNKSRSQEPDAMSKPTRFAHLALQLTAAHVKPLLATDAKINLGPVFAGLTRKNFDPKKLRVALDAALKDKLAKDATMEQVAELLDTIAAGTGEGSDESVSPEQHNAMEAAAHGNSTLGIPKKVGEEFVSKDQGVEKLKGFLKEKGMNEDDVMTACDMLGTAEDPALDEDEEAKKKRDEDEKADAAAAADASGDDDEKKDKDMVSKGAMDAAIKAASEATAKQVRAAMRGTREAEEAVRPYIGTIPATLGLDSAEQVYRHALKAMGVPGHDTIHESALRVVLGMQPKQSSAPERRSGTVDLGMDEAAAKDFATRFPGADRIGMA